MRPSGGVAGRSPAVSSDKLERRFISVLVHSVAPSPLHQGVVHGTDGTTCRKSAWKMHGLELVNDGISPEEMASVEMWAKLLRREIEGGPPMTAVAVGNWALCRVGESRNHA